MHLLSIGTSLRDGGVVIPACVVFLFTVPVAEAQVKSGAKELRAWERALVEGGLANVAAAQGPLEFRLQIEQTDGVASQIDHVIVRASCKNGYGSSEAAIINALTASERQKVEALDASIATEKSRYEARAKEKNPHPETLPMDTTTGKVSQVDTKKPVKQRKRNPAYTDWANRKKKDLEKMRTDRVKKEKERGDILRGVRSRIEGAPHEFRIDAPTFLVNQLGLKAGETRKLPIRVEKLDSTIAGQVPVLVVMASLDAKDTLLNVREDALDGYEVLVVCEREINEFHSGADDLTTASREEAVKSAGIRVREALTRAPLEVTVNVEDAVRDGESQGKFLLHGRTTAGIAHQVKLEFDAGQTRLVESKKGEAIDLVMLVTSVAVSTTIDGKRKDARIEEALSKGDLTEYHLVLGGRVMELAGEGAVAVAVE